MTFLNLVSKGTVKFAKGIFISYSLLFAAVLIVQSCKKTQVVKNDKAAERFLAEVSKASQTLQTIAVKNINSSGQQVLNQKKQQSTNTNVIAVNFADENQQPIGFINFDEMPINPNYSYNINGMASLVANYDGIFSYQPSDNSIQFQVPLPEVANTLQPLISEAKIYLNSRGLTNADIDDMILEEGAQEVDLVPYATALAKYEQEGNAVAKVNYVNLFFTSANARTALDCAMVALGIDALWALGGSNAAGWTRAGMKKAFGAVAKRALGPIGVAIAVVSFGLCMGDWIP